MSLNTPINMLMLRMRGDSSCLKGLAVLRRLRVWWSVKWRHCDGRPGHRDFLFVKWRHCDEQPVHMDFVFVKWLHCDKRHVHRDFVFMKWRLCDERPGHRDFVFVKWRYCVSGLYTGILCL